ncbi:YtcA family lipoprotein [Kaistia geumhonensis]|uniref:Uncharacterized protein YtcA n=1 Tax=Kaistia geumhonensis TaxID=410839 RepID=A0ABU0M786_9HYPH|nr:YtcA family lipoprotein [Kaistia geumhonensis]MCX5477990.1 YtcA family lipoprotein [Kaistia geumhonensis]MDQ0516797.1 hypothetical protein [Kaistia geumhonensis]
MRDAATASHFSKAISPGARLLRQFGPPAAMSLLLSGCTVSAGAPSIALFGAYFPSWLACALAGILGAVLVRLIFIPLGVDDMLPVRLPVYVAIAAAIGFLVSLLGFGR